MLTLILRRAHQWSISVNLNHGLILLLTIHLLSTSVAAQSGGDVQQLELNKPVERELAGGQSHSYRIVLTAGQYLRVVADQRGIDIAVSGDRAAAVRVGGDRKEVADVAGVRIGAGDVALDRRTAVGGVLHRVAKGATATLDNSYMSDFAKRIPAGFRAASLRIIESPVAHLDFPCQRIC